MSKINLKEYYGIRNFSETVYEGGALEFKWVFPYTGRQAVFL